MTPSSDAAREWALLEEKIDPLARAVLAAVEPWDAYRTAMDAAGALTTDELITLPHGGGIYRAWSELSDFFEWEGTPISDAHAALREAAHDWLKRPKEPSDAFIEGWIDGVDDARRFFTRRDGDWWNEPGKPSRTE
ncbi:MAG: hypothetical protein ACXVYY_05365 [Oryzihumus sp.]